MERRDPFSPLSGYCERCGVLRKLLWFLEADYPENAGAIAGGYLCANCAEDTYQTIPPQYVVVIGRMM